MARSRCELIFDLLLDGEEGWKEIAARLSLPQPSAIVMRQASAFMRAALTLAAEQDKQRMNIERVAGTHYGGKKDSSA